MKLRALEHLALQPVLRSDSQGWHDNSDVYQREYLFEIAGLPQTRNLPLITPWPEIGLASATTHLALPDASDLDASIIPLI